MTTWLKQSTAATVKVGPFIDTDGAAVTNLTIQKADVRLSKNGGNMAAASADQGTSDAGATHDELGVYDISLDTTDTGTLGLLRIDIKKSGALHCWSEYLVVTANVYDSFCSTDKLEVDVGQFGGTNGTFSGGRPEVNMTHAAGTAWGSGGITANSIANDAITAAKLASDVGAEIADAVLDEATAGHTTAGSLGKAIIDILADTNEMQGDLADGGRIDLLIDSIITALQTIDDLVDTEVTAILEDTGTTIPGLIAALNDLSADDVLDEAVEGSITLRQATRLIMAALVGKLSGAATTTVKIRDTGDSKDRISATVDADGNRTAVTLDAS